MRNKSVDKLFQEFKKSEFKKLKSSTNLRKQEPERHQIEVPIPLRKATISR